MVEYIWSLIVICLLNNLLEMSALACGVANSVQSSDG